MHPGARGIIDQMLDELGRQRNITARCAHFGLIPDMVASSLLVLTTGRQYCERFARAAAGRRSSNARCALPRLMYYQLWHERTHSSSSARWLRERTKAVAASLRPRSRCRRRLGSFPIRAGVATSTDTPCIQNETETTR